MIVLSSHVSDRCQTSNVQWESVARGTRADRNNQGVRRERQSDMLTKALSSTRRRTQGNGPFERSPGQKRTHTHGDMNQITLLPIRYVAYIRLECILSCYTCRGMRYLDPSPFEQPATYEYIRLPLHVLLTTSLKVHVNGFNYIILDHTSTAFILY